MVETPFLVARLSAHPEYLYLWRRTSAATRATSASYPMIVDGTGLSKGSAQTAVGWLVRRRLIDVKRRTATSAPSFTLLCHWRE